MFTGLIEAVGEVVEAKSTSAGLRLRIRTDLASELTPGDSLAVNGVCLTVTLAENGEVHVDIGPETARVSTLASLRRAQPLNLERSIRADSRFGGHFVQGHVDGVGLVEDIRSEADARWLTVSFPPTLAPYLIRKGSVAVDGISLTIAGLGERRFDVMIITYTWDHTNLGALRVHDRVNLECDVIGKYVVRQTEVIGVDRIGRRGDLKTH
jgi:riboflavin synthase